MPTIQEVEQARNNATTASQEAGAYSAGQYNVESVLKQKLTDAYKANQDIVKPLDEATSNYFASPAVAREKYQNIFNPFEREKLVSLYTNNQAIPMQTYSNLYGQRQGSIADTINAGVGGYKSIAESKINSASVLNDLYKNLLGEYQFEQNQALEREKLYKKDNNPFAALMESILNGTQTDTTEMPQYTPSKAGITEGDWMSTDKGTWEKRGGETDAKIQKDKQIQQALVYGVLNGDISGSNADFITKSLKVGNTETSQNMIDRLKSTKGLIENIGMSGMPGLNLITSNPAQQQFKINRDLIGMEIAKQIESGRLSDQDRTFYLNNMPSDLEIAMFPTRAKNKMDALINYFSGKSGIKNSQADEFGFTPF